MMSLPLLTPGRRLALALAVSALAGVSTQRYLRHAREELKQQFQMTTVLSAKKFIPEGKTLSPSMIEAIQVPITYVQPTALTDPKQLLNADGSPAFKTRIGFLKGEQVTKSKLIEESSRLGLSWQIPSGLAAVGLKLPVENAAAGWIKPGDSVSVFVVVDRQSGFAETAAKLLLPRALVVAVQEESIDRPQQNEARAASNDSILVTLGVAPNEVAPLMLGSTVGKVQLALLSPMNATEELGSANLSQIRLIH